MNVFRVWWQAEGKELTRKVLAAVVLVVGEYLVEVFTSDSSI